jgi:lambda family phage portal protein
MADPLRRVGNLVDSLVGVFAPGAQLRRRALRTALYAAAQTTDSHYGWNPVNSNVNDIIRGSSPTVRARVRQLVRDFPFLARAVNAMVDYTVGEGITFQARVLNRSGQLDNRRNGEIEDAFKFWGDEADVSGKLHYYEMMQLSRRQGVECGEFLMVRKHLADRKRYLPLAYQMYEPDWLTDYAVSPAAGNKVDQGIEFKPDTGQVVAYHFTDPDGWGKSQRIEAEFVIHGFRTVRPGQLRGITDLSPAVLLARDLDDLMGAELDGAKMAAKWLAIVKTIDPYGRQVANNLQTVPGSGKKIETLENGIIEYLGVNEDVELKANPRPGSNFPPYVRLLLTMLSVVSGIPYEILSGDYQGLNFTTGKMIRSDLAHQLRPIVKRHIRHYCLPTQTAFMDSAVLGGKLALPSYYVNPRPWMRGEWQPPGMEPVDPSRETKSTIDQIKNLLRSPQEVCRSRGRDFEEVVKECADAKQIMENHGVAPEVVSTALANNTAAIDKQK